MQSSTTHLPLEDGVISTNAVCLDIQQTIRDRCNKTTAAKYTNALMHGLNSTRAMAALSVTGLGELGYNNNTSSMRRHYRAVHEIEEGHGGGPAQARPTRKQDLDEALVNLIVKDTQPFSVVED
ncbi:hypothetical protein KUCAC02_036235, partial [Chaenocephalus aceratus]